MDRWVRKPSFIGVVADLGIGRIKDHADSVVSDEAFSKGGERWADAPTTKEAYFIRQLFDGNPIA
jgi:asparagine synthase (glutamine-hydrolysing)